MATKEEKVIRMEETAVGITDEQAIVVEATPQPPRRNKVAILGFTETWKTAPFGDPNFEIWGLNELYQMGLPRYDRWFELHDRRLYETDRNRTHEHIEKLRGLGCPLYMQQHYDDIPNSIPYPLDVIAKAFPNPNPISKPYLTNSISYMIALAIYECFEEIWVCGVDMAHNTEYCLDPKTLVLKADMQYVPLSDISIGDELVAFDEMPQDGQQRQWRIAVVEEVTHLTRPCYQLEMKNRKKLIASAEHRWLIYGNDGMYWSETKDIAPKMRIVKPLIGKYDRTHITTMIGQGGSVIKCKFIGDAPVIGLKTTTGTFIAEGFASHNSQQRPSCEFFVGIAMGKGIKVWIPDVSDLLKTPFIYGYEQQESLQFDRKIDGRKQELQLKFDDLSRQIQQLDQARQQYAGALQDIDYWRQNWRTNHS